MTILIVHASKHGCTKLCAERLAELLRHSNNVTVDIRQADKPFPVKTYDHIILGSAIYANKPLKTMVLFCREHHRKLTKIPVSLFLCGLSADKSAIAKLLDTALPSHIFSRIKHRSFFGGRLIWDDISKVERAVLRMLKQTTDIDNINAAEIERFAKAILAEHTNHSSSANT